MKLSGVCNCQAWLRQNECRGGDWVVSQPAIAEGDTIVVVVDMVGGTALFRKQNGTVLKTVSGVGGGIMYPAAAFRRVGTRVSFVEPALVSDEGA